MEKDWKEILEKPGKEFRSAPFWAWNEKINEKESKFQIQEMCDKGMGGFFIHSPRRTGNSLSFRRVDGAGRNRCSGSERKRTGSVDL